MVARCNVEWTPEGLVGWDGEDQATPWEQPLPHLEENLRLVGDVFENIKGGDDVVPRTRVHVGEVSSRDLQAGAGPCHLCRLDAQFEPLNLAAPRGDALQYAKDITAATPNLEDAEATRKIVDGPVRQSGERLVPGPEPEVPVLGHQQSLNPGGIECRPVTLGRKAIRCAGGVAISGHAAGVALAAGVGGSSGDNPSSWKPQSKSRLSIRAG